MAKVEERGKMRTPLPPLDTLLPNAQEECGMARLITCLSFSELSDQLTVSIAVIVHEWLRTVIPFKA